MQLLCHLHTVSLHSFDIYVSMCVVNVKKLAGSVRNDDSSIATLQEDERNKLSVSSTTARDSRLCMCVMHFVHIVCGMFRRLKQLKLPLRS